MASTNVTIAVRHLLSKKKQTIIAILGVTFGIAMYITMASVMAGVNSMLDDLTFQSTAHVRLYKEADISKKPILSSNYNSKTTMVVVHHQGPKNEKLNIKNVTQVIENLKQDPAVYGVSAQVSTPVFYNYGALQYNGVLLGVDIKDEDRLFNIKKNVQNGNLNDLLGISNGVLLGAGLAKKFNVTTGDNVTITTPRGVVYLLKIVGIYKSGLGAIDNVRSYVSLSTAQKLLQKDKTYITDISLKLKDREAAVKKSIEYSNLYDVKAENWKEANAVFEQGTVVRNIMTYVVSITLLIVAGFGIYNIISMNVHNKIKDIAILKATGFSGKDVVSIFMMQAVIIGFIGAFTGIVIGFALSLGISTIPFTGGEYASIDHFPVKFSAVYYVFAIIFGIVTTLIAAYLPSKKASRVDPVVILRG